MVNTCSVISRDEVERLLILAKEKFRSKRRVNRIMFGKIDEVARETKQIVKDFLLELRYEVNQPQDASHLEGQNVDTSVPEVHIEVSGGEVD